MSDRTVLYADPGMVYTNGTDYGRVIWLAEGADPAAYYQIAEAEYDARMEGEQAEAADYEAALARLGVE